MSDSEELKPPCDCIEQNSSGAWYVYDCQCTNSGDLIEASSWCGEMNEKAKHNTRPSVNAQQEGTDPMTVGDLIEWLSLLRRDGVILNSDGKPFDPISQLNIKWDSASNQEE